MSNEEHLYENILTLVQKHGATGIRRDNIYRALSGGRNTAGGFIWKYSDAT